MDSRDIYLVVTVQSILIVGITASIAVLVPGTFGSLLALEFAVVSGLSSAFANYRLFKE